ncbi:ROK family protein [Sinirhodobacter populi]|uniref:N-acetylglucosamine kinase n=2 Tax=Paenirhodobacter populi TaxID=2306993 RepID=A0A443JZI9_9RHOB|nr:ROK family protein [Sinirhodobacter populi]
MMATDLLCGAIDLGGTKIEARLFDGAIDTVKTRRIPTPTADFDSFIAALGDQIAWLCEAASDPALPVGLALAGWIDPATGNAFASNIPVTGRAIGAALADRFGRRFPLLNDCMAFAYSEAHGGAGAEAEVVLGLILGTGMGAGLTVRGEFPPRLNGVAVEIGHVGMPARALAEFDLPVWPCGCGKAGCMERYVSGTGLAALARHRLGREVTAPDLIAAASGGDRPSARVLEIWADLTAEALLSLQLILDPSCIVLGGGLSNMPDVVARLSRAFDARRLGPITPPPLRLARFGDSSGARGAALYARARSRIKPDAEAPAIKGNEP